jgi:hypothetical protein
MYLINVSIAKIHCSLLVGLCVLCASDLALTVSATSARTWLVEFNATQLRGTVEAIHQLHVESLDRTVALARTRRNWM